MDLRYPIGEFTAPDTIDAALRDAWIDDIAGLPVRLREAVAGLDDSQLDTPYRPDGWSVRQVVHHVPESHMNAYIRFKLALTEDKPTIRPYNEADWAKLDDARAPVDPSLDLLDAVHRRWLLLLRTLSDEDFARSFHHPEYEIDLTLSETLGLYAWHGNHHTAHVTALRDRMGWT